MQNTPESKDEIKFGSNLTADVALAWGKGRTVSQIAAETGLSIEVVIRELKTMQKAIVEDGAKSHGTENKF